MKKGIKKLKKNAGFTLAETLMTVLILLMVSSVVAGGIPSAVTAYSKAVDAANAQVLISTTVNALRSELTTAKDVHVVHLNNDDEKNEVIYISPNTGSKTKLYLASDNTIMVQDFLNYDETGPQTQDGKPVQPRKLVSDKTVTDTLQISYSSVDWNVAEDEVLQFNTIIVKKGSTEIVTIDKLYIRPFQKRIG